MTGGVHQLGVFDHAGVAVANLEDSVKFYQEVLGGIAEPDEFTDPLQQVRIRFINLGGTRIELLQPLGPDSHLHGMIRRGIGLYHLCYRVQDLDGELTRLQSEGVMVISPPKPAKAFGGRRVAFTMHQGLMIELLEV
jgi:methylmalonyl-CoA/ethylmalonyl-CoA epimerase